MRNSPPPPPIKEMPRSSLSARAVRSLLKLYQGWSKNRTPVCRFIPSCSTYADEAIEVHGTFRGSYYTIRRLLKCHPLGSWGYDPPPEKKQKKNSVTVPGESSQDIGHNYDCEHDYGRNHSMKKYSSIKSQVNV